MLEFFFFFNFSFPLAAARNNVALDQKNPQSHQLWEGLIKGSSLKGDMRCLLSHQLGRFCVKVIQTEDNQNECSKKGAWREAVRMMSALRIRFLLCLLIFHQLFVVKLSMELNFLQFLKPLLLSAPLNDLIKLVHSSLGPLQFQVVVPLRADGSLVEPEPNMEFDPYFCPAITSHRWEATPMSSWLCFGAPNPMVTKPNFSGHKMSLVKILPFFSSKIFIAFGTTVLRYEISRCAGWWYVSLFGFHRSCLIYFFPFSFS